MHENGRFAARSSFRIPRSSFPIVVACLTIGTTWTRPAVGQGSDRFLDWSHQDASHLVKHHTPEMLLIGLGGAAFVAGGVHVDKPVLDGVQSIVDRENLFVKLSNEAGSAWAIGAPAAVFALATALGDDKLQDASFTSFQAILYAGFFTRILKETLGRRRPETGSGPKHFEPFSGNSSIPSGHATIAFSMLTPWVYYYDHPATYGLFAVATGTMISRIVRDKHWPTDVVTGGAIGFLIARYLSKRHLDETEGAEPVIMMPLVAGSVGGIRVRGSVMLPAR